MWLQNLHIVLPDQTLEHGSLRIEAGEIAEIIDRTPPPRDGAAWDGAGLILMPGIIDMHGDMLEREIEPRPRTFFPTDVALFELDKRLAAAGITTAYTALSFLEPLADPFQSVRAPEVVRRIIDTIQQVRAELLVDMRIHARFEVATPGITPFLAEMLEAHTLDMLSLMDHTPGQGQYRNIEDYIMYVAQWRKVDPEHIREGLLERMRNTQDARSNWELARAIVEAAAEQGLPIASHDDDTSDKVDLVASLGCTICEFPVTLEAAYEARRRGMHVVMGAPNVLRGGSHSGNLSALEALAAGAVDSLAADYHPATLLHAAFILVNNGTLPLYAAVRLISTHPAAALRLYDRGSIVVGKQADLLLVEPGECPRVRGVLRRGVPIYLDSRTAGLGGQVG